MDAAIIYMIGPMGCGKTTVGKLLAKELGWRFADADDFHPAENVKKMEAGIPLTDADRLPWLETLHEVMQKASNRGENYVVACSALRESYRKTLGIDQKRCISIYLKGTPELLRKRLQQRQHPYMDNNLLTSQLEAFEEPQGGMTVEINESPEKIVAAILVHLRN